MPIYEFYCHKCNTIYNFFSRTVNTDKVPACPVCGDVALKRRMSVFATIAADRTESEDGMPPIDESRMEQALSLLAREAGSIDEDDPRQAARLMRKLSGAAGLAMGPGMEEALSRMERGEDPESIEAELGDLIENEEPFVVESHPGRTGSGRKPRVDETLYEL